MEDGIKQVDYNNGSLKHPGTENGLSLTFMCLGIIAVAIALTLVFLNSNRGCDCPMNSEENYVVVDEEKVDDEFATIKMTMDEYINQADAKIAAASTSEEKRELYIEKAIGLQRYRTEDNDLNDLILDSLFKAEDVAPNMYTARWISIYEGMIGNDDLALEYAQKAEERGYSEVVEGEG